MKIVKVIGGLGNQMFQYAFYKSLKVIHDDVKLDISPFEGYSRHNGFELNHIFNIRLDIANNEEITKLSNSRNSIFSKAFRKIIGGKKTEYIEREIKYNNNILTIPGDTYYEGYWQSEKYFMDIQDAIRRDFTFSEKMEGENLETSIDIENNNSISIHIRRGDYVTNPNAAKVHGGVCTLDYYNNAISYIVKKVDNPVFYIFSDDIDWVKENLRIEFTTIYIDWNKGKDSYKDMQLMSKCKHNIIANSTFSWWGAWLNNNNNKIIISPTRWFSTRDAKDVIPDSWIRM